MLGNRYHETPQTWPHSTGFSGSVCPRSSKASRGEDLEIEEPVLCRDCSSVDFYPTWAGMLGATLVGDQVVQMGQPDKKRLLAPVGMMTALDHEQCPVDGVRRLIEEGAGDGHTGGFADRLPPRFRVLEPAPDALPVGHPCAVRHVVGKVA
jgi:RNA polymerase subunit RPABC4/transcription elongation factor Spt4